MQTQTLWAATALLLAASAPARASDPRDPRALDGLRARIAALLAREDTAGAGLALVDRSGPIWVGGVGLADVAAGRPVTADTLFRAASVAKSVTALALMRLVEAGRLDLDSRLRDLAPEVELDNPWEETHPLRVAHLLEHTSGFDESHFNEWWDDQRDPRPLRALLAVNPRARRSRWPPGARMSYSNENYLVAGFLLEKLSGQVFDEAARRLVFEPLEMRTASFRRTEATAGALARGYRRGKPLAAEEQMIRSAANLVASPRDLARYLAVWLGRGRAGAVRLLAEASIDRIERGETLLFPGPGQRYGLGNDVEEHDGHPARGHAGFYEGFIASLRYFPGEGVGWALLLNSERPQAKAAIERELSQFLLRGPPAQLPEAAPLSQKELRALAGSYRSISPRIELFSFLSGLAESLEIEERDGRLVERASRQEGLFRRPSRDPPQVLVPTFAGEFRRADESVSSVLFAPEAGGGMLLVTPSGSYRRTASSLLRLGRAAIFGALALLLSAPLAAAAWLPRLCYRRQLGVRELARLGPPLLASASFLALYELLSHSPARWGRFNATTAAACGLSWTLGISAAFGLAAALAIRAGRADRWARLHATAVSAAACGLAALLWRAGWIGIRLWSY